MSLTSRAPRTSTGELSRRRRPVDMTAHVGPAVPPPRLLGLAVGVLIVTADASDNERMEQRLALALAAYQRGYFLLDLFEVTSPVRHEDPAFAGVERLAVRARPDALVVHGEELPTRLAAVAADIEMTIVQIPADAHRGPVAQRSNDR